MTSYVYASESFNNSASARLTLQGAIYQSLDLPLLSNVATAFYKNCGLKLVVVFLQQ